ncbi:MAG: hypothetical protein ABR568_24200, partial [Pyrinomonadaceae bacterium]
NSHGTPYYLMGAERPPSAAAPSTPPAASLAHEGNAIRGRLHGVVVICGLEEKASPTIEVIEPSYRDQDASHDLANNKRLAVWAELHLYDLERAIRHQTVLQRSGSSKVAPMEARKGKPLWR